MLSFSNTELTHATRLALGLLLAHEQRRCGKREVAFENVAELVGMSSSWLKKFVRDSGEVNTLYEPVFLKISNAYGELCARIEQENEADERRLLILKDQIDALACRANAQDRPEIQALARKARGLT